MSRNTLIPFYIHDIAQVSDKTAQSYPLSRSVPNYLFRRPFPHAYHQANYMCVITAIQNPPPFTFPSQPFCISLSLFSLSFFFLSLSLCLYVAGLFFNEHFLRSASLFLPSRRVSTLYLESHLHHYDISGGQVRTATYQRIFQAFIPARSAYTPLRIHARASAPGSGSDCLCRCPCEDALPRQADKRSRTETSKHAIINKRGSN